jgi:hypothetical protein
MPTSSRTYLLRSVALLRFPSASYDETYPCTDGHSQDGRHDKDGLIGFPRHREGDRDDRGGENDARH